MSGFGRGTRAQLLRLIRRLDKSSLLEETHVCFRTRSRSCAVRRERCAAASARASAGPDPDGRTARQAHRHRRRSQQRDRSGRDGHGHRPRCRDDRDADPSARRPTRASRRSRTCRPAATASARSSPASSSACCATSASRAGDNKHVVVLPLKKLEDSVTVGRDTRPPPPIARAVGVRAERDAGTDPGALRRSGGAGATDRRAGGARRDHPRRQLRRAAAAAEGADQVDPRHARPVRGRSGAARVDVRGRRHPARHRAAARRRQLLVPRRLDDAARASSRRREGPEQFRDFGGNIGGTLVHGKTSFSIAVERTEQLHHADPERRAAERDRVSTTLGIRQPITNR